MYCKKCGSDIKEGNSFCTNCGKKVNNKEKMLTTNNMKIKPLYIIISVIVISVIVAFGIAFSMKSPSESLNSDGSVGNNLVNTEQNKIYITQDSKVSPTGKEFRGVFSDKLTEEAKGKTEGTSVNAKFITYETSIEDMIQYSEESYMTNNITKQSDKFIESTYYYNETNKHFIGCKQVIYMVDYYSEALNNSGSSLQQHLDMVLQGRINLFMNYHNMEETEKNSQEVIDEYNKYQNFALQSTSDEVKTLKFDNYACAYKTVGMDLLLVYTYFNDNANKFEVLFLAYDENTNPEDVIKEWYNRVYTKAEINHEVVNLLEQIYAKYPELEGTEGLICSDGELYWILDENGNKDYFSSIETFEQSYNKNYGNTSNNSQQQEQEQVNNNSNTSNLTQNSSNNNVTNNSNSSNIGNNTSSTTQNNTPSNNVNNDIPVDTSINISHITTDTYPNFKDAKKAIEGYGLIVNEIIEKKNVEFIYMTKQDEWKYQDTQYIFEKGDKVSIVHTIYVATDSKIRFSVNFGAISNDKNITPLLSNNAMDCGVKVYFDNELAFTYTSKKYTSSNKAYEYSLPANKKIRVKLVADYYIEGSGDEIVNQQYVITEYNLDTTTHKILYYDLYNRESWYFGK